MLKYLDTMVTFSEVPDEVALCINLTNCPYHCPDCHSKELWEDSGQWLSVGKLCDLVAENKGISCICFMGGDSDLEELYNLFKFIPMLFKDLKIAWYTGRNAIPKDLPPIHYIKVGPYKAECGPINNPNTNQRFYTRGSAMKKLDVSQNMWYDTTDKFWKNGTN